MQEHEENSLVFNPKFLEGKKNLVKVPYLCLSLVWAQNGKVWMLGFEEHLVFLVEALHGQREEKKRMNSVFVSASKGLVLSIKPLFILVPIENGNLVGLVGFSMT